ncbi:MAG: DUF1636 domain-containing protein [Hormoscilla sp.]
MSKHAIFVCTTCATVWKDGKPQGISGGQQFLEQLQTMHSDWELRDKFPIQEVKCMSACSHHCAVSFAAADKYTYVFGDLQILPETAAAVLACASQYYAKPDGMLPWSERPQPMKKGVVARIPPL